MLLTSGDYCLCMTIPVTVSLKSDYKAASAPSKQKSLVSHPILTPLSPRGETLILQHYTSNEQLNELFNVLLFTDIFFSNRAFNQVSSNNRSVCGKCV